MTTLDNVRSAMVAAFDETSRDLAPWPNPRGFRESPADDEYSRVTDPAKYRIAAARARAWTHALQQLGAATVVPLDDVEWHGDTRSPTLTSSWRLDPAVAGAVSIVVGLTQFGGHDDVGVVLGVGQPAVRIGLVADCGCDACDRGSDALLEEIDDLIEDVVTGVFVHRSRGSERVVVRRNGGGGNARFLHRSHAGGRQSYLDFVLANTVGWHDISGPPWIHG